MLDKSVGKVHSGCNVQDQSDSDDDKKMIQQEHIFFSFNKKATEIIVYVLLGIKSVL